MAEDPREKPLPEPPEERNGLDREAAPPAEPPRRTYPPRPKR